MPTTLVAEKTAEHNLSSDNLAMRAIGSALEQKGLDVVGLRVADLTYLADYFVVISGTSARHVKGIADRIRGDLKLLGETPNSVDGYDNGEWILLDYGDVIIHVFFEATRKHYELDKLWAKAERLQLAPQLEQQARMLRTGMY